MNNERFASSLSYAAASPRLNLQALPSSRSNAALQSNPKDTPEGSLHAVGAGHKFDQPARANKHDVPQQTTATMQQAGTMATQQEPHKESEGSSPESRMARAGLQLRRLAFMNDGNDTRLLVFTLPTALVRGFVRVATSPEFIAGGHSWHVVAERGERHIGFFLALKNAPTEQLNVEVEYTFTLVNREHFCRNESFGSRSAAATFSARHTSDGRRQFVPIADLHARGFLYDSGRALIELELGNVHTVFVQELPLAQSAPVATNSALFALRRPFDEQTDKYRIESAPFQFGGREWHLSLLPSSESQRVLRLERLSLLNVKLLVSYRMQTLAPREELLGDAGSDWSLQVDPKSGRLPLSVRFDRCVAINELELWPMKKERNWARVFDSSGREWILESDMIGATVKLRLFLSNAATLLPPSHALALRLNLFVLGANGRRLRAVGNPIAHYFNGDPNCYMRVPLDITMQHLIDPDNGFVSVETGTMKVLIEWLDAVLLSADAYDTYDASIGIQKIQMRREIAALQAENYQLEKQVFSYQQSISRLSNSTPHSPEHSAPVSTQRSSSLHSAAVDIPLQHAGTVAKLERHEALRRNTNENQKLSSSSTSSSGVVTALGTMGSGSHDSGTSGSASGDSSSIATVRSYGSNASSPPPVNVAPISGQATSDPPPPPLPQKRVPNYERTSSRNSMGLQGNGSSGTIGGVGSSSRAGGRAHSNNAQSYSSTPDSGTPVRKMTSSRSDRMDLSADVDPRYTTGAEGNQVYYPQFTAEKRGLLSRHLPAPPTATAESYDNRAGTEWVHSSSAGRMGPRPQPGVGSAMDPSRMQDPRREKTASRSSTMSPRDDGEWYKH